MGSSSKKTKTNKDGKKRRHRSRSNSEDEYNNKEKHHRHRRHHHKDRRHEKPTSRHREYDSDGSDVIATSPQSQQQQQHYNNREETPPPPPSIRDHEESPQHQHQQHSKQNVESLSIDDTNKLRAKLGLKPLELPSDGSKSMKDDGKLKDDLGEFYHKPALNLAQKTHHEKLRTKLTEKKEKRHIDSKLSKVKRLGDSDSDDDTESWVEKNRRIQADKEQARKRARILEELDEEFGVSDIVDSELRMKKQKIYTDKSLKGLKVEHDLKNFSEGKSVILTLKDQDVLAEEASDVLVNVNMIDDERYEKSNEFKKKKPGYQAYDDEFDEDGNLKIKSLLSKYDEEIDGEKKRAFVIGGVIEPKRTLSVKEKLSNKRLETLVLPQLNIASEYYTEEEMTKFKKPKKRVKKLRPKAKILTAAELAAQLEDEAKLADDHGSRKKRKIQPTLDDTPTPKGEFTDWMDIDDLPEVKPMMDAMIKSEDDNDNDKTLERALHKARKLKQKEAITLPTNISSMLLKDEPVQVFDTADPESGSIVLNATAEFCRSLGDIPTYGKAGNRDEDEDLIDFEGDNPKSPSSSPSHPSTSTWNNIDAAVADHHQSRSSHVEQNVCEAPILDEEPDVGSGVGAALKLAMSKGYLDKEENNRPSNSKFAHLQARHYSIEDKTYGDDDKFGGRRERYQGPTMDFKEKDTFRPNVKLEYIDDEGRVLNPKEAFRYLSHKFHGKGPGKNKIEKRIKKTEQEGLMKKMSSTDTPLGTLNMLQHKQKEMQSPYIVLSGSKHTHSTTISKARR